MNDKIILSQEAEFAVEWWAKKYGNAEVNTTKKIFDVLNKLFTVEPADALETLTNDECVEIETDYLCTFEGTEYFRVAYI
jgi:hypothetical protein